MSVGHEILTPEEAADFLRLSRSTLYQRQDIPRHRLPRSRQIRYLRSELLAWLKGELIGKSVTIEPASPEFPEQAASAGIDIDNSHVYHRNTRYR